MLRGDESVEEIKWKFECTIGILNMLESKGKQTSEIWENEYQKAINEYSEISAELAEDFTQGMKGLTETGTLFSEIIIKAVFDVYLEINSGTSNSALYCEEVRRLKPNSNKEL